VLLATTTGRAIDALVDDLTPLLGADGVTVDLEQRRTASTDWAHMSPVLRPLLPAGLADVVAFPTAPREVATILALAHRRGVAVTPRGEGTGNYGQGIPLHGGLVVDLSRCRAVLEVGTGWVRAQAGASFVALERAAAGSGQELAMLPSTVGSTIGGFLGGGSGGTGSIENGFNGDGFVLSADVAPCTDEGVLHTVTGAETAPFIHAYGVSGVLAEVVVRLVPRRDWTALFTTFADVATAQQVTMELMALDPPPRLASIDDAATVRLVDLDDPAMPTDRTSMRAILDTSVVEAASRLVEAAGGRVEEVRPKGPAYLTSLSYNHINHRALKKRTDLVHLQVGGPGLVERTAEVYEALPETSLHFDGMRVGGRLTLGGMLLCRYSGVEALYAGVARLAELGVSGEDPHTWMLQRNVEQIRVAAARFDPDGLLNPGKLPAA